MKSWLGCVIGLSMVMLAAPAKARQNDAAAVLHSVSDTEKGVEQIPSANFENGASSVTSEKTTSTGGTSVSQTDNKADKTKSSEGDSKDAQFVDKDGDGINDGKEHRFRNQEHRNDKRDRKRLLRKGRKSSGSRRP